MRRLLAIQMALALLAIHGAQAAQAPVGFIQARGPALVVSGREQPIFLRGVNLTNQYWDGGRVMLANTQPLAPLFDAMQALGVNFVRLAMNHELFESPRDADTLNPAAWEWIDRHLQQARPRGIYILLDMHVPPKDDKRGRNVWNDDMLRQRLARTWAAIARRYRDDPLVAGYDLINEPITLDADGSQYRQLVQQLAGAIRAEDQNHLIVVERLYGTGGQWHIPDGVDSQFLVDDANVLYDFHFYEPFAFTHQGAEWVDPVPGPRRYPSLDNLADAVDAAYQDSAGGIHLQGPAGEWQQYQSDWIDPSSKPGNVLSPQIIALGHTQALDAADITLQEYDAAGVLQRTLLEDATPQQNGGMWDFWRLDDTAAVDYHAKGGPGGGPYVGLRDVTHMAGLEASGARAWIKPGLRYRLSAWLRLAGRQSSGGVKLDNVSVDRAALAQDRAYLARRLDAWLAFAGAHQVPVLVGEFGVNHDALEEGRGGERWTADMLALMQQRALHFAYWDFFSPTMGLYLGENEEGFDKAKPQQALLDVLRQVLQP